MTVPLKTETAQFAYADALRALAACMIVLLHVTSPIAQNMAAYKSSWWWLASTLYSCTRPSIALFFMISGALLLAPGKSETLTQFFKRRFAKIWIPFLFWGAAYFFWKNHGQISPDILLQLLREFVKGPVYYHLWFIYTITAIYLTVPVFRIYLKHAPRENLRYLMILWLVGSVVYPLLNQFCGISIGIAIMIAGGFLGCFIFGHYLATIDKSLWSNRRLMLLIGAAAAFTQVATWFMSQRNHGVYEGTFESFLSFNVLLGAAGLFLLFKNIHWDGIYRRLPRLSRVITAISGCSFSIYLMHIMVLEIFSGHLGRFKLCATTIHPIVGIPLTTGVVIIVCVLLILVLRKVRFMRLWLP